MRIKIAFALALCAACDPEAEAQDMEAEAADDDGNGKSDAAIAGRNSKLWTTPSSMAGYKCMYIEAHNDEFEFDGEPVHVSRSMAILSSPLWESYGPQVQTGAWDTGVRWDHYRALVHETAIKVNDKNDEIPWFLRFVIGGSAPGVKAVTTLDGLLTNQPDFLDQAQPTVALETDVLMVAAVMAMMSIEQEVGPRCPTHPN